MEQMKLISVLLWILLLLGFQEKLLAQSYFDERGKRILYPEYEEKILSGPYFGVPGKQPGEMRLVYRMPVGLTDARIFYEKLGKMDAYKAGQPLVVIFYPGKDECNSAKNTSDPKTLKSDQLAVLRFVKKHGAAAPAYLYHQPHGLEKYEGIQEWIPDPEGIFSQHFFSFPYPCRSFVVISPKGNYRAILGEFPISQIDVALKKL